VPSRNYVAPPCSTLLCTCIHPPPSTYVSRPTRHCLVEHESKHRNHSWYDHCNHVAGLLRHGHYSLPLGAQPLHGRIRLLLLRCGRLTWPSSANTLPSPCSILHATPHFFHLSLHTRATTETPVCKRNGKRRRHRVTLPRAHQAAISYSALKHVRDPLPASRPITRLCSYSICFQISVCSASNIKHISSPLCTANLSRNISHHGRRAPLSTSSA
jgi:hypothetical protein